MTRFPLFIAAVVFSATTAHAGLLLSVDARRADAEGHITTRVTVRNLGGLAATGVRVQASGAPRVATDSGGWTCVDRSGTLECTLDRTLAARESASFDIRHLFGAFVRLPINASVVWTEGSRQRFSSASGSVARPHRFLVTNANDAGPGSLRAAIEAINADVRCLTMPCGVEFQIAAAANVTAHAIVLRSPLPRITQHDVRIDGESQTELVGNTNAAGPEIALIGSELTSGNGIEFRSLHGEVRGLAIGGFPGDGIAFAGAPLDRNRGRFLAAGNYIGTDATSAAAVPNFRGISLGGSLSNGSVIRDNVISGNVRSAIFDWAGQEPSTPLSPVMRIENNGIGVAANANVPLPNGASGIFFGPQSDGTDVVGNLIAFNREFGVAVSRTANMVHLRMNSIVYNGSAIDVGLDGPTPLITDNSVNRRSATITSARYDPATNTTTIEGTPAVFPNEVGDFSISNTVQLYANDTLEHGEYAEAQHYLGDALPGSASGTFTFTFPGDLRGSYVTALATRALMLTGTEYFDTTELSKAVQVH